MTRDDNTLVILGVLSQYIGCTVRWSRRDFLRNRPTGSILNFRYNRYKNTNCFELLIQYGEHIAWHMEIAHIMFDTYTRQIEEFIESHDTVTMNISLPRTRSCNTMKDLEVETVPGRYIRLGELLPPFIRDVPSSISNDFENWKVRYNKRNYSLDELYASGRDILNRVYNVVVSSTN